MVQIHHVTLSRTQLESIPEGERRLFILAAHVANELNVLSKFFHFSTAHKTDEPILVHAHNAQSLVLARVLTGKIYECWRFLNAAFFATALSKSYESQFEDEAKQALEEVKRYFGRKNPIELVRNKHAFHYALDQVDAGFSAVIEGDPLEIYFAKSNANTLFAFGDAVAGRAMLETIRPGDAPGAFETLHGDTVKMVRLLGTVLGQIMALCIKTHLGGDLYSLGAKVIEVEGAPDSQEVSIPYFIEITDEGNA